MDSVLAVSDKCKSDEGHWLIFPGLALRLQYFCEGSISIQLLGNKYLGHFRSSRLSCFSRLYSEKGHLVTCRKEMPPLLQCGSVIWCFVFIWRRLDAPAFDSYICSPFIIGKQSNSAATNWCVLYMCVPLDCDLIYSLFELPWKIYQTLWIILDCDSLKTIGHWLWRVGEAALPKTKQIKRIACCAPARMLPWGIPLSLNIQTDGIILKERKKLSPTIFFLSLTKFAVTLDVIGIQSNRPGSRVQLGGQ